MDVLKAKARHFSFFRDAIKNVAPSFQKIIAAVIYSFFHPIPLVFVIKAMLQFLFK